MFEAVFQAVAIGLLVYFDQKHAREIFSGRTGLLKQAVLETALLYLELVTLSAALLLIFIYFPGALEEKLKFPVKDGLLVLLAFAYSASRHRSHVFAAVLLFLFWSVSKTTDPYSHLVVISMTAFLFQLLLYGMSERLLWAKTQILAKGIPVLLLSAAVLCLLFELQRLI